jgi:hypothetical protein
MEVILLRLDSNRIQVWGPALRKGNFKEHDKLSTGDLDGVIEEVDGLMGASSTLYTWPIQWADHLFFYCASTCYFSSHNSFGPYRLVRREP